MFVCGTFGGDDCASEETEGRQTQQEEQSRFYGFCILSCLTCFRRQFCRKNKNIVSVTHELVLFFVIFNSLVVRSRSWQCNWHSCSRSKRRNIHRYLWICRTSSTTCKSDYSISLDRCDTNREPMERVATRIQHHLQVGCHLSLVCDNMARSFSSFVQQVEGLTVGVSYEECLKGLLLCL